MIYETATWSFEELEKSDLRFYQEQNLSPDVKTHGEYNTPE